MKLVRVHIFGYGKWEDRVWDISNNNNLSLFMGKNEAGKSTLMSFIQAVLFGFPKKGENQFIPVKTDKYGGSVSLLTEDYGSITIQRIKGNKVKGDVTVFFPEGQEGGEEELLSVLKGLDQHTFQGIFHFNLDGLNGLGNIHPEDLNQFLYDTGIGGAQQLTRLEKKFYSEMELLFKPRGKKTEMNLLLKELEGKKREKQRWEDRIAAYEQLKRDIKEREKKHNEVKKEWKITNDKINQVEKADMIFPLAKEWEQRRLWLKEGKSIALFPEKGLERLEALEHKRSEVVTLLKDENVKLAMLERDNQQLECHPFWKDLKREIEYIDKKNDVYQARKNDWKEYQLEKEHLSRKKNAIEKEWSTYEINFSRIVYHQTLKSQYDQIKEMSNTKQLYEQRLKEEIEKVTKEGREEEGEVVRIEQHLMSKEELALLKNKINEMEEKGDTKVQKLLIKERLNSSHRHHDKLVSQEKQQVSILGGLTGAFLLIALYGFLFSEGIITVIGAGFTLLFLMTVFLKRNAIFKQKKEQIKEQEVLQTQLRELDNETADKTSLEHWKREFEWENERRRQLEQLKNQLQRLTQKQDVLFKEWDELQEGKRNVQRELKEWAERYRLPLNLSFSLYDRLLESLEKWNAIEEQLFLLNGKMDTLYLELKEFEDMLEEIIKKTGLKKGNSVRESVQFLIQFYDREVEKGSRFQRIKEQIQLREESLLRLQHEKEQIEKEMDTLLRNAEVNNEEDFRRKAYHYEQQRIQEEEKNHYWIQMKTIFPDETLLMKSIQRLIYENYSPGIERKHLEEIVKKLELEMNTHLEEIATLKQEVTLLEQDGTYEEILLTFSQLNEELKTLAKQWATYSVGSQMIKHVKGIYERERQPAVIKKAEEIFQELTDGEYKRVYAPLGEERFIVEHKDGARYEPSQLSRGTCEMLYLAFRFALASLFSVKAPFPIIMDETLVNMDRTRRIRVVSFLNKFSKGRQILLFTCHHHIANEFQCEKIDMFQD
ncbi:ATP-binding protein [Evansella tamaricis]|uniref:AAA family ATPase n=1 Tax=Evansella tamaricis TaxID=2069301 RepID=A0ABS6JG63_9BACI|nr:AAA family ATPase [Evansella tamaricis]MBU9712660.1 AAA family ATPase [Evansella tamaricis]